MLFTDIELSIENTRDMRLCHAIQRKTVQENAQDAIEEWDCAFCMGIVSVQTILWKYSSFEKVRSLQQCNASIHCACIQPVCIP